MKALFTTALLLGLTTHAHATGPVTVVIDPDDYPDFTVLNNISPVVTLSTGAFDDNRPTFDVVAYPAGLQDTPSTGTKLFAHAGGIPFWTSFRTFRMDFPNPPQMIEIDYIASGFFDNSYAGRLEAYDASGSLIAFTETALLAEGQVGTLSLAAPGIAYALAFPPDDPFGDLDYLRITIPEPASVALLALGLLAGCRRSSFAPLAG